MRSSALLLSVLLFACGGETVETGDRAADGAGAAGAGGGSGAGGAEAAGATGGSGTGVAGTSSSRAGESGASGTGGSSGTGGASATGGASGTSGAAGTGNNIADFVQAIEGVWLVGWSGGANHYSWMRFSHSPDGQGVLEVLDPTDVLSNIPYWNCQGVGSWNVAAKVNTIFMSLPKGCDPPAEAITFGAFEAVAKPGVLFRSAIEINSQPAVDNIEGYKMESSSCDAAFTVCEGPF